MHIEIERNFVCSEICMIEIIILSKKKWILHNLNE
jgi:hypothetical protein